MTSAVTDRPSVLPLRALLSPLESPGSRRLSLSSSISSSGWSFLGRADDNRAGMSTLSPPEGSGGGNTSGYGSGESNSSRSPLSHLSLSLFKSFSDRKATRDGQAPKKRGPKPDSKPAQTRRQELNRQAQRTHRERKEQYIKALEQEVLRLKETASTAVRERDAIAEELRKLKALLKLHGITYDEGDSHLRNDDTFSGSASGSYAGGISGTSPSTGGHAFSSPPTNPSVSPSGAHNLQATPQSQQVQGAQPQLPQGPDLDQLGIDFVLTSDMWASYSLEHPCMDHIQFLLVRAEGSEEDVAGHVVMASCPPHDHIKNHPDVPYTKPPELRKADLRSLLDASMRVQWDGEIPPVNAWAMIFNHPRNSEFTLEDIESMKNNLKGKVRCYGFGAVLEDFEVRDAISNVLASKVY
ncbi:hypothetical protein L228DRAFT_238259 [Xylona heveae TC161]|uniref:BZIP domain-containing protein n=1 Tax=Xylona heveae (strain CBS 132557 / TC161) TaxID=1328760 RepID=A0A161TD32_XYLHT|nr:hypothetical protein L228DRAFT_238259 [Xylona heveae TC161]KZF23737.1 hypothetical protein L228DRAFT_238259 [Xylona heveae TC161]